MAELIFIPFGSSGSGASAFYWYANGDIPAFEPQPGSFNGMLQNNVALSGPGPFDSQRLVEINFSIGTLNLIQRTPSTAPSATTVEFYRIRGAFPGTVTSLGTVSLNNTQQFQAASAAPAVSDLVPGDVVFVSFVSTADWDASDLSCFLERV